MAQNNYWLVAESNLEKKDSVQLKSIALLQNCKMKSKKNYCYLTCKKMFLFEKINKIFNLILCFSEIPKTFICVRVRQVTFLYEDWKKLSVWSSVILTVFASEMCEREAYRKQTGSSMSILLIKVSALEQYRFMQVYILSHDYLEILNPIINVVDGLNIYQWFK